MTRKIVATTAIVFCLSVGMAVASPVGRSLNTSHYQRHQNYSASYQVYSYSNNSSDKNDWYTGKNVDTHYYGGDWQNNDCGADESTNPSSVPEPISALLMLVGMGGAAAIRRIRSIS